jgi:hypothetical protein
MPRLYVFADEAGCFEFSKKQNVSKYFILCTISMASCDLSHSLLDLRRRLIWEQHPVGDYFHATTDKQAVRDAVYDVLMGHDFKIHATIMEKSKAQPQVRASRPTFYQYGWYYHFRHVAPKVIPNDMELLTTAATLGTSKERASFSSAVESVMGQVGGGRLWKTNFSPAAADPCVQAADYCAWALQRKYERNDCRSYDIIKDRIIHEYDLWSHGKTHYY